MDGVIVSGHSQRYLLWGQKAHCLPGVSGGLTFLSGRKFFSDAFNLSSFIWHWSLERFLGNNIILFLARLILEDSESMTHSHI